MDRRRQIEKLLLEIFRVKPRPTRLVQQGEIVGHNRNPNARMTLSGNPVGPAGIQALKLSPQEQLVAALGFLTLNPPVNVSR